MGNENYGDSLIDMVSYPYDASEHRNRPVCRLWPQTDEQVPEILKLAIDLDGTLTGEHDIGLSKAPCMTLECEPVAMVVIRSIKKRLDPNTVLNAGKMALEV